MATRSIASTKKYRALLAAFDGDKDKALQAYTASEAPVPVETDPQAQKLADLVEAGFSAEQAEKILSGRVEAKPKEEKVSKTSQEKAEALVAKHGLTFTKGRVYVTPEIIEAAVRVLKTAKPEVVKSSGAGRVHSVLIFRTEGGDAAIQNTIKPS